MSTYQRLRYLLMTKDPVHVGTGGYRLGRVDNSIVREPGTRVPKIPGTSLHGAARAYAARLYETPQAAGQSHDFTGADTNPVCYTFGYLQKIGQNNDEAVTYAGSVNVFDALIALFPVYSLYGPVWVSTIQRLSDAGFNLEGTLPAPWPSDTLLATWNQADALNLGWLMLRVGGTVTVTPRHEAWQNSRTWQALQNRIVLVQPSLFSQVVNSNLEVRTSVSIDPETGAAKPGALFTYEALPRATVFTMDAVIDDYRSNANGTFPVTVTAVAGLPLPGGSWQGPRDVLEAGLRQIEWLGVGGMGTRGFGRIAPVADAIEVGPVAVEEG